MTQIPAREETAMFAALRAAAGSEPPFPAQRFTGRGIVMCAGGVRLFTCAWVSLWVLRNVLDCTMPVEVWHLPGELGEVERSLLAELAAVAVDAGTMHTVDPPGILGGWELKPYALANSSFREVLLLDADNVAVENPTRLFDDDAYGRTGALFWPDADWLGADSEIWSRLGLRAVTRTAWESGQLVLDKRRSWAALRSVRALNDHSDLVYRYVHGDKDTFLLAWLLRSAPYTLIAHAPRVMTWGLLQHGPDGRPLFQHRNQHKWRLRGENPLEGFRHGAECLAALHELDRRWSGRVEPIPAPTGADSAIEARLARQRLFRLERDGGEGRWLELLPGHLIGEGVSADHQRWHVHDGVLILAGVAGPTARLTEDGGIWHGVALGGGGGPLALAGVGGEAADPVAAVVAALLGGVDDGRLAPEEALGALHAIGRISELEAALVREGMRRPAGSASAAVLQAARRRIGRRDPSLRPLEGGEARRYGSP